jgi:hypothetical protein
MIELVKKFDVDNAVRFGAFTANTIILPMYFVNKIEALHQHKNETTGYLICSRDSKDFNNIYIVEHLCITGEGNGGSVSNTFKVVSRTHCVIQFHVHPEHLGQYWFDRFSSGDFDTFREKMKEDEQYIHILFTPTHILTFGKSKCDIRIGRALQTDAIEVLAIKDKYWKEKLNIKNQWN